MHTGKCKVLFPIFASAFQVWFRRPRTNPPWLRGLSWRPKISWRQMQQRDKHRRGRRRKLRRRRKPSMSKRRLLQLHVILVTISKVRHSERKSTQKRKVYCLFIWMQCVSFLWSHGGKPDINPILGEKSRHVRRDFGVTSVPVVLVFFWKMVSWFGMFS